MCVYVCMYANLALLRTCSSPRKMGLKDEWLSSILMFKNACLWVVLVQCMKEAGPSGEVLGNCDLPAGDYLRHSFVSPLIQSGGLRRGECRAHWDRAASAALAALSTS